MKTSAAYFGIKAARLLLMYTASAIAVRMHEARYVEEVYGKGEKPPALPWMLVTMAGFLLVFDALLLAAVKIAGAAGVAPFNRGRFVAFMQAECVCYTVFVVAAGYYMTTVVARKKYLSYRSDGLRALRALREMIMAVVVPVSLTPVMFVT